MLPAGKKKEGRHFIYLEDPRLRDENFPQRKVNLVSFMPYFCIKGSRFLPRLTF